MALLTLMPQEARAQFTAPENAPVDGSDETPVGLRIFDEDFAGHYDREISKPGPDGTLDWLNGPDGFAN